MSQTTTWAVPSAPSGLAMRNTVNTIFDVLRSNSSGASAPSPTVAGMFWFDESVSPPVLRQRNAANTGWNRLIDTADLAASRTALGATATGSALFTAADVAAVMALLNSALVTGNPQRWIGPGAVGSRLMIAMGTASTTTSGVTVPFPLSFVTAPYIQVTPIVSTTPLFGTYQSPGSSSFVAQTWDAAGVQTAGSVSWLAVGVV